MVYNLGDLQTLADSKEMDSMATLKYTQDGQDFDIVGADDYTGNLLGDNLSRLVFELIDMANKKLPNWTEIRMDKEFGVAAYTEAPRTEYGCWVCDTNEFAPLDYFESNRGLNWQDFGIIRTEETEADAPELVKLPENLWQHAHVVQPERTIADIVTLADNRLTVAHIRAIADLHETAQAFLVEAIADGRIVLGGAK